MTAAGTTVGRNEVLNGGGRVQEKYVAKSWESGKHLASSAPEYCLSPSLAMHSHGLEVSSQA